jgi:hypothetical protein
MLANDVRPIELQRQAFQAAFDISKPATERGIL